jgi:hypothetical protein
VEGGGDADVLTWIHCSEGRGKLSRQLAASEWEHSPSGPGPHPVLRNPQTRAPLDLDSNPPAAPQS